MSEWTDRWQSAEGVRGMAGGPAGVLISLVCSAVLTAGWWFTGHTGLPSAGQWIAMAIGWLVLASAVRLSATIRRPGLWLVAILLGAVLAIMRVLGGRFDPALHPPYRHTRISPWVEFAVDWLIAVPVICVLLEVLAHPRRVRSQKLTAGRKAAWWAISAVLMLAAWAPYLLAFWPGIVVRDSWSSIRIGTGMQPLNNHHPIAFSLLVGMCIRIGGSFTAGTAVFSVLQALLLAFGLAICVVWLRYRAGPVPAILALAWLALDPSVAMWSITMQKDTLFALVMTLMTVLLAEAGLRGWTWLTRPWPLAGFLTGLVGLSFTRNNGTYIVAFMVAGGLPVPHPTPGCATAPRVAVVGGADQLGDRDGAGVRRTGTRLQEGWHGAQRFRGGGRAAASATGLGEPVRTPDGRPAADAGPSDASGADAPGLQPDPV